MRLQVGQQYHAFYPSKLRQDYRCLWCKESVHGVCRLAMPTICNLGRHRVSILSVSETRIYFGFLSLILQPTAIKRRKNTQLGISHWTVCPFSIWFCCLIWEQKNKIEPLANTNPLIVFVNPKSGSNDGVKVMRMFKRILNPLQAMLYTFFFACFPYSSKVFDLSRGGPREGFEIHYWSALY